MPATKVISWQQRGKYATRPFLHYSNPNLPAYPAGIYSSVDELSFFNDNVVIIAKPMITIQEIGIKKNVIFWIAENNTNGKSEKPQATLPMTSPNRWGRRVKKTVLLASKARVITKIAIYFLIFMEHLFSSIIKIACITQVRYVMPVHTISART